jgi:hypothetical protein
MDNMKKISSILLALFIALTFSNSAIAGEGRDASTWEVHQTYRCNITYVKRYADQSTKKKYHTTQHRVSGDKCNWGAKKLSKKIIKWMKKETTNEVIDFSEGLACKQKSGSKWGKYVKCDETGTKYRKQMIKFLSKKYPEQTLVH